MDDTKRVQGSYWEMPKGFWIAAGQFLEALGKLLGKPK
jgi:hypothetical protein